MFGSPLGNPDLDQYEDILDKEDIPPEDQLLCNDAEGCDHCPYQEVCFDE